jgi:hypothetical protein
LPACCLIIHYHFLFYYYFLLHPSIHSTNESNQSTGQLYSINTTFPAVRSPVFRTFVTGKKNHLTPSPTLPTLTPQTPDPQQKYFMNTNHQSSYKRI